MNPQKCSFGVASRKFLGFIVHAWGIVANLDKIRALIDMMSPKKYKDMRCLIGRIAVLSRLISKSTEKCIPFLNLLKGGKKFE